MRSYLIVANQTLTSQSLTDAIKARLADGPVRTHVVVPLSPVDQVDEVIVSTLPMGMSRWLGEDVPSRLRDSVPVPVTVVTQESVT